jgi:hypothetical protein
MELVIPIQPPRDTYRATSRYFSKYFHENQSVLGLICQFGSKTGNCLLSSLNPAPEPPVLTEPGGGSVSFFGGSRGRSKLHQSASTRARSGLNDSFCSQNPASNWSMEMELHKGDFS